MSKRFLLYDGRARWGDTDRAAIFDTADTEAEARRAGREIWDRQDAVWFEYDHATGTERIREDLPPAMPEPRSAP